MGGREQVHNYLDIQLRNMDYLGNYGTDVKAQFFDPNHYYQDKSGDYFEKKFTEALEEAKKTLVLNKSNSKVETNPVVQTLVKLYNIRLQREKKFIKEWETHFGISRKGKLVFPMTGNYGQEENYKYAQQFSNFIQSALGAADDPIISALRNEKFCEQIAGISSKVFSTAASKRKVKKSKDQSDINRYYERLFETFFFGAKRSVNGGFMPISIEDMLKNGSPTGKRYFQEKFQKFIRAYYPEIADNVDEYIAQIGDTAADKIYQTFKKSAPKSFKFTKGTSRGASYDTQQQLKKMLISTLQQLVAVSGKKYSEFSVPGLLEVYPDYREIADGFHATIQVNTDGMKRERTQLRADQAAGIERDGKKIDMRNHNKTYIVDRPEDEVVDIATGESKQLKTLFLDYLCRQIKIFNKHEVTSKERHALSTAVFQKLDQTIKRGDKALDAISAYGPAQVRGLLGEIATAYALQIGTAQKTYTEVTGGDRASGKSGGQLHYDVVATIHNMRIGFQVKNYANIDNKGQTLYGTTIGLGRKDMYKYFKENDVRNYRWLYANGQFITKEGFNSNLQEEMELSLFNSMHYFLRIADAQLGDKIQSDIYVLGNFYIPSSYLICCAIKRVKQELQSDNQKMFTFTGQFPNYRTKATPKDIVRTNKDGTTRQSEKHTSVGSEKNIVWINDTKKTRIFGSAQINFRGVNIKFTI